MKMTLSRGVTVKKLFIEIHKLIENSYYYGTRYRTFVVTMQRDLKNFTVLATGFL